MDIKKAIIEVLNEHLKATTKEIADTYLMLPRERIESVCEGLANKSIISIYNEEWYLVDDLIVDLIEDVSRLEYEIDILHRENTMLKNVIITRLQEEGKRRE